MTTPHCIRGTGRSVEFHDWRGQSELQDHDGAVNVSRTQVTKRPDGIVERKALNPETYRRAQAREWTAKTQAAKIRRKINITQDAFARMLGVSLGTVRKWERGTHRAKRRRSYAAQDRRKIPSHRPRGCHVLNNHRPYTKECPDGKTPKRIIALCSEC